LKNLQEIIDVMLLAQSQSSESLIYRLYHDDQGHPLFYSMEHIPELKYVNITPEQFNQANSHVRVVNGQIKQLNFVRPKLMPHSLEGQRTHPRNVALIQPNDRPHVLWNLVYHDNE